MLAWTEDIIRVLGDGRVANSLRSVQEQIDQFNAHRNADRTPKVMRKGNLEVLLILQSMTRDINVAWERFHIRRVVIGN